MIAQPLISRLLDNRTRDTVGNYLHEKLRAGSDLSVASAYFTIYAYQALADKLEALRRVHFLFGEPDFINILDHERNGTPGFDIAKDQLQLASYLEQSHIAKACAAWIRGKVEMRSVKKAGLLHGKMYHISQGDYARAVLGSSNFTVQGLGLSKHSNIELNMEVTDDRDRDDLKAWFDEVWQNKELVQDVKEEVLRHLERLYLPNSPQFLYFKTLYHLFGRGVDDPYLSLKQPEHLYDSDIWQTLFEFQQHGAKAIIRKLLTHNGCILADSVGLGKTYTALAVMKYFETLNYRILVLCPKKLRENWTIYQVQNNSPLNPFLGDRFAYTVLSHTDLSRESGLVGDINLATLNWSNYDLVIIDESHNFRNNTKSRRDEEGNIIRKSRYERLLEDILNAGIPSKVLLLSATPVNNTLSDLRNQLMLLSSGNDAGFKESIGVSSLKGLLGVAQRDFNTWAEKGQQNTESLLLRLNASFFSLLDELTLARSREHVRRYYADTLERLGGFPERHKPISIYAHVDKRNMFPSFEAINTQISGYRLSLFNPYPYVRKEFQPLYERDKVKNFSQKDRENYLVAMMKVNFLKRLEEFHLFFYLNARTHFGKN